MAEPWGRGLIWLNRVAEDSRRGRIRKERIEEKNMAISGGRNVLKPGIQEQQWGQKCAQTRMPRTEVGAEMCSDQEAKDSSGGRNVAESRGRRQKWEQEKRKVEQGGRGQQWGRNMTGSGGSGQ